MKLTASLVSALVCLSSVQGHATDEDQIVMKYVGTGEPTKPKGRSPEDPFIYVQRQQKLKVSLCGSLSNSIRLTRCHRTPRNLLEQLQARIRYPNTKIPC